MNSNKTSLKSQLIRLGLVVPLALASVGVYATDATQAQKDEAAKNAELTDYADWGTEKDTETDFSGDPFAVATDAAPGTNGDEVAAKALETAITGTATVAADTALKAHFAAGHEAGRDLINFNPAGASDGVISVQAGVGSASIIFAETAVTAKEAVAATTTAPAKPERPAVTARTAGTLADLTVSAKNIVLGTGSQSSLNGADKLVLGGFAGYGALGFASKLHHSIDENGKDKTDENGDGAEDKAYQASVVAKSSGFGGGLFATYQADADSGLGFSAGAKVRYTNLTHLLTKKEIADVTVDAGATDAATDDVTARKIKKTAHGYKNGAVAADLDLGYALQLAEVSGFPIIAKGTAKVGADYDKFEKDSKDETTKGVLLVSQTFGLNLATALLDGKLQPSIGVSLAKTAALDSQGQDFAGVVARKDEKFSKFVNAGLAYHFSDAIALNVGGNFLLQEKAKEEDKNKVGRSLGFSALGFGLNYRF